MSTRREKRRQKIDPPNGKRDGPRGREVRRNPKTREGGVAFLLLQRKSQSKGPLFRGGPRERQKEKSEARPTPGQGGRAKFQPLRGGKGAKKTNNCPCRGVKGRVAREGSRKVHEKRKRLGTRGTPMLPGGKRDGELSIRERTGTPGGDLSTPSKRPTQKEKNLTSPREKGILKDSHAARARPP